MRTIRTSAGDLVPVLPAGWNELECPIPGGFCAVRALDGILVIVTEGIERDGRRWRHVSVSHRKRLPGWDDLKSVKELFIGAENLALQVLPPASSYVNVHPNCLHLWRCLDGDPVPDFTKDGVI